MLSMLTNSRYLVVAFELWAIAATRVRAQTQPADKLEPAYLLRVVGSDPAVNRVSFDCDTIDDFDLKDWVLYRNSVPENSSDPCISPGRDPDNFITITSECDGLFSCGANYTNTDNRTGLVLSKPLAVYAIPVPMVPDPQTVRACVGDTAFIPSYFPVSALADDVEVVWHRVGTPIVPADNGNVTDDYSYKVENVTMADAGQYFAIVTVPNQISVQGYSIVLAVAEKPVITSVSFREMTIILEVSPDNPEVPFHFEWKVDGEIATAGVSNDGKMLTLPQDVSRDNVVEVMVYSDCGASHTATLFLESEEVTTERTVSCPTVTSASTETDEQQQTLLTTGLVVFLAVLCVITLLLLIASVALACLLYCRGRDKDKQIELLRGEIKVLQEHSPRAIADDPAPSTGFVPLVVRQTSVQTSEVIVRFKSDESGSETTERVNHIATVLYEVIPLIKDWEESDGQTLHAVYVFLNSVFKEVRQRSTLHYKTKACISNLMKQVQALKNDLDLCSIQRSASSPGSTAHPVLPQQESVQQDEDEERGIVFDGTTGRSISAPAEVGESQQQKLAQLRELAEIVGKNLDELCEEMSKNDLDDHFAAATEKVKLMGSDL